VTQLEFWVAHTLSAWCIYGTLSRELRHGSLSNPGGRDYARVLYYDTPIREGTLPGGCPLSMGASNVGPPVTVSHRRWTDTSR